MSASSSTTGGRRQVRTPGIPSKCWCGVGITELISKTNQNSYRLYYQCICSLENDNHVFKWIDEAFTDEIQQLENQVRMLKEEVQFLKATRRSESELSEGPKIMEPKIKISGGCVILAVVLVLGIKMYKK
ncbi:BnaC09g37890D [Brassica napus]|uniref:BnaC09g37890D protein n=1 Tax=Brassica napus TaxID=3708 RepID=A0A078HDF5_BRANA|nr:BnaC09g37890D [Brassica napus]